MCFMVFYFVVIAAVGINGTIPSSTVLALFLAGLLMGLFLVPAMARCRETEYKFSQIRKKG